ncbi:para-aminobenzoate synthetase component 1 [Clostridium pascui]|uniref:aminodeoxychorismate synthase component I n=1 Tax=Clostridium pascui TaxID=46609 RepID=UPI00195B9116|nr:aminodeoxychorismate synthase component I [Clostridium pascui]MBM7871271.1 para-aminobenzoate synthetase component 1 [Clostridium pascui]
MNFFIKEINTKLDPFDVFTIFKDTKNAIILDSSKKNNGLGEYSFIGINTFLTFKATGSKCSINDEEFNGDGFTELENLLKRYKIDKNTHLPFSGGCIGYFSYDASRSLEKLPETAKKDIAIPDIYFNFYDNLIIFDHINNKTYISASGIIKNSNESIKEIEALIANGKKIEYFDLIESDTKFYSNFDKSEYIETVGKVREYIRSGDVYIANLTQRFWCYNEKSPYEIYKNLRYINPAPFSAYLNLDDFEIISSSPERFIKIRNGKVETRPIKGTRPRGTNEEEDKKNKKELINSEKDKSELLMIVDLERNDLSKVCKPFSVKVTELFKLEEYSTVFHLVSSVEGELKEEVSSVECIRECFPGGSITGAPKIRSMEIIEELEGIQRNIYTGIIGYFDFSGNADFNIVIRTILNKNGKAYFGVGGGITWDSNEKDEYFETLDKAKALMRVL